MSDEELKNFFEKQYTLVILQYAVFQYEKCEEKETIHFLISH